MDDFRSPYKVVKFIVNVKLMENSVNSHAGKVYVTQYKRVGSTPRTESTMRPRRPKVDDGVISAAFIAATEVTIASAALETAAAGLSAIDVTASRIETAILAVVGVMGRRNANYHKVSSTNLPVYHYKDCNPMILRSASTLRDLRTWVALVGTWCEHVTATGRRV